MRGAVRGGARRLAGRLAVSEHGRRFSDQWHVSPTDYSGVRCKAALSNSQCAWRIALDSPPDEAQSCCHRMPGATADRAAATVDSAALFHYVTRSAEDFAAKAQRGSGMSNRVRKWQMFEAIHRCAA